MTEDTEPDWERLCEELDAFVGSWRCAAYIILVVIICFAVVLITMWAEANLPERTMDMIFSFIVGFMCCYIWKMRRFN